MKVDLAAIIIYEYEVGVGFAAHQGEAALREDRSNVWNICNLSDEIEVVVVASLLTEQGIDAPPAVNPGANVLARKSVEDCKYVVAGEQYPRPPTQAAGRGAVAQFRQIVGELS